MFDSDVQLPNVLTMMQHQCHLSSTIWAKFDISKLKNAGQRLNYVEPENENEMTHTKIKPGDIKSQVNYWERAVSCYV